MASSRPGMRFRTYCSIPLPLRVCKISVSSYSTYFSDHSFMHTCNTWFLFQERVRWPRHQIFGTALNNTSYSKLPPNRSRQLAVPEMWLAIALFSELLKKICKRGRGADLCLNLHLALSLQSSLSMILLRKILSLCLPHIRPKIQPSPR